jgi:hypothetical protein
MREISLSESNTIGGAFVAQAITAYGYAQTAYQVYRGINNYVTSLPHSAPGTSLPAYVTDRYYWSQESMGHASYGGGGSGSGSKVMVVNYWL